MIDLLQDIAFWIYVFSLIVGAVFTTSQLDEIRDTISSGDKDWYRYSRWYQEFQVFAVACIFTFVPLFNTFICVMGIALIFLNTDGRD